MNGWFGFHDDEIDSPCMYWLVYELKMQIDQLLEMQTFLFLYLYWRDFNLKYYSKIVPFLFIF